MLLLELDSRSFRADTIPPPNAGDIERFPWLDSERAVEERVELLFAQMTSAEKVEQLHGTGQMRAPTNHRLHIPSFQPADGPHGIGEAVWRYIFRDTDKATNFPVSIALASSWSPELAFLNGAAIAREARGKGRNWLLAPDINLVRDPRGGRSFESFSEDPHLVAELGKQYIRGAQSEGVIATPKHFAAHNQETHRRDIDVQVDERTLRELYLPAFRAAVVEAGALSVMAASHIVNGVPCTENPFLLRQVLKEEWNFEGVVVSDWKCMNSTVASIEAGLDLEMPKPRFYGTALLDAVRDGKVSQDRVDEAVRRVLRLKLVAGLFDRERRLDPAAVHTLEHQRLALDIARAGLVLLKNEDATLPLTFETGALLVSGFNAPKARKGGGGSSEVRAFSATSPLDGIRLAVPAGVEVEYVPCCNSDRESRRAQLGEVAEAAGRSEAAVLVLGLSMDLEGEGLDRVGNHLRLPPDQIELIAAVSAVQPRTIVVLVAGSAISMRRWGDLVPSVLTAWYPGEKGGVAIGEVLFGAINPSGKLPITFPADVDHIPSHAGFGDREARYEEGVFIGYRYQDQNSLEPLFPFGHGLSYTTFAYQGLRVDVRGESVDVVISATFEIENTGPRAGVEIAQLYVADLEASEPRPPKELKGFARVELDPGERTIITLQLDWKDLAFWSPELRDWAVEPGEFEVLIGASSRDLRLREKFELPRAAGAPGATRGR